MAAKKKIINTVGFKLHRIITEQFAIIKEFYDNSNEEVGLSINLQFGLDKENHLIASSVQIQFMQNSKPFLVAQVANQFEVEEQAWKKLIKSDDKLIIPKGFATHLIVLTIGTLRGVLHAKTENTEFNKFVLPTINVMDLVKDDVELGE